MHEEYWTGAHTKHRLKNHLVWIPKYRKRVLRGKLKERLRELLYEACEVHGWWIHELSVQEDHLHMLVQTNPRNSIAEVVRYMKGGSSRILRKEFPKLKEFLWGANLWGDGYFAESVGATDEEVIKRYIRDQRGC